MELVLLLVGLAAGGIAGWVARDRRASRGERTAAAPSRSNGSDPLLDWVLRATGAQALLIRLNQDDVIIHGTLAPGTGHREALEERLLMEARDTDREGVERTAWGTLLWVVRPPAAGMLVHDSSPPPDAIEDLRHLLHLLQSRPLLTRVAREQERPGESVESIAVRLAHQLERICEGDTLVVLRHSRGVEILGVALRGDTRLLHARVTPGSAADRVARGENREMVLDYDPVGLDPGDRRHRERRSLVYPICAEGEPVGAAVLWPVGGGEPTGAVYAALRGALDAAGPRLQAALARREEKDQAVRDPLTGLHNRRGFEAAMQAVGAVGGVYIAADLDHFKRVNDTLGHAAGDAALVHFAAILERLVRGRDVSGRVGGEEFAIWLPDQDLDQGSAVAERVREALAEAVWTFQGTEWPLTASFGVAAWPGTTNARENLAAQADAALYRAKEAGRNCVQSG